MEGKSSLARRPGARSRRGQSLVEFALTVPILILVFAGIVDLGRSYYFEVTASDASRDAVRLLAGITNGVNGPSAALVCGRAGADMNVPVASCVTATHAPPFTSGTDYTAPSNNQAAVIVWCGSGVTTCGVTGSNGRNQTVGVSVVYGFVPITPLISSFLSGGVLQMTNTTQMVANW
jgi:Flp pilus assembly protein TadG